MSEVLAELKKNGSSVKTQIYTGTVGWAETEFTYTGDLVFAAYGFAPPQGLAVVWNNGTFYGDSTYFYIMQVDTTNKTIKIRTGGSSQNNKAYALIIVTQ